MIRARWAALMLGLATLGGCGNGLHDLRAKLTLDGKPLEGAVVTLLSVGESRNRSASGMSDAAGDVRFTTFHLNDGVLPGSYKVIVVKMAKNAAEAAASYDRNNPEDLERLMALERSGNVDYTPTLLPRAYLTPDTTPLSCTVPTESGEVVFDLDSSLGKKK